MRVFVRVKTGAKMEKVAPIDGCHFDVWVKARPVGGKANEAVAAALAEKLGVSKSCVRLVSGAPSKTKVFEISGVTRV